MKQRRLLGAVVATCLTLGLVSCGPGQTPASSGAGTSPNTTTGGSLNMTTIPTDAASSGGEADASSPGGEDPVTNPGGSKTESGGSITRPPADSGGQYKMKLVAEKQAVDILREDGDATRRLVYLRFTNNGGTAHKGLKFAYTDGGKARTRDIADIYLNNKVVIDTLWVPRNVTSLPGVLTDGSGKKVWGGTLAIEPAPRTCTIKKSRVYGLSELKPMTVRGMNYYPRHTPWTAWSTQKPEVWDSELKEISKLNVNAIRTFADRTESDVKMGNCVTPEYLETLDRLFATADKYGILVKLCLYPYAISRLQSENMRLVRSIVETFQNDGRVLGWDLINEVDASGLTKEEHIDEFCRTQSANLSVYDPNHLNNIGFAWMLDKAVQANLTFNGKNQCWQYHYYRKFTTDIVEDLYDRFFNKRPFFIGEFGQTSYEGAEDIPDNVPPEDWQREVYQSAVSAARGCLDRRLPLIGIFAWTAFDFPNLKNNPGEAKNGLIRADGSLKPAGQYLAQEYAKLKKTNPAQWDK